MKSKIEEKIKNAREATNEMFAAFEELNERLSEKLQPEFKEGDYFYCQEKEGGNEWLSIFKKSDKPKMIGSFADYLVSKKSLHLGNDYLGEKNEVQNLRLQTPSEIALLDSKLAEQGKRFDKEKLELVDIEKEVKICKTCEYYKRAIGYEPCCSCVINTNWTPKVAAHKEPIVGEMAIFWDTDNKKAFCATLNSMINGRYSPDGNIRFANAILFESTEQYKAFLKS